MLQRCFQFSSIGKIGLPDQCADAPVESIGHVGAGVQKNPPGCPVNGNEQVAPGRLVGHLRQILDVDVNEAWLVVFEGLPAQPSGSYAGYGHGAIGLARRRDRATCLQSLA